MCSSLLEEKSTELEALYLCLVNQNRLDNFLVFCERHKFGLGT